MDSDHSSRAAGSWQTPALYVAVLALLALRIAYAFLFKVNSDEPQHLHVVWGWTQGLLPYRDFFDNHTPLFHALYAPMLAALGERADIIPLMRLGMLPIYFASLWITWLIGRRLWSRDVAWIGTSLAALYPSYFELSIQFRTDNLWALAWLAMLLVIVSGRLGLRRGFVAGLLLGVSFAISLKSILLLVTAVVASLIVFFIFGIAQKQWRTGLPLRAIAGAVIGACVAPSIMLFWFVAQGAWEPMMYCLFGHNVGAGTDIWDRDIAKLLIAPVTLPLALWLAWYSREEGEDRVIWARRAFVLLAASGYLASLYGYWPLFTRQGLLPVVPVVGLGLAALLVALLRRTSGWRKGLVRAIVPFLLVAELASLVAGDASSKNIPVAEHREKLKRILALTKPGEFVMDAKGESVFRMRPVYWVLETITLERMRSGSIVDDIPEKLVETGTKVVIDDRLPERARAFVLANYLRVDRNILVAGQALTSSGGGASTRFVIEIEGEYTIIGKSHAFEGTLNGSVWKGSRYLAKGEHEIQSRQADQFSLIWTPALERGVAAASLFVRDDQ